MDTSYSGNGESRDDRGANDDAEDVTLAEFRQMIRDDWARVHGCPDDDAKAACLDVLVHASTECVVCRADLLDLTQGLRAAEREPFLARLLRRRPGIDRHPASMGWPRWNRAEREAGIPPSDGEEARRSPTAVPASPGASEWWRGFRDGMTASICGIRAQVRAGLARLALRPLACSLLLVMLSVGGTAGAFAISDYLRPKVLVYTGVPAVLVPLREPGKWTLSLDAPSAVDGWAGKILKEWRLKQGGPDRELELRLVVDEQRIREEQRIRKRPLLPELADLAGEIPAKPSLRRGELLLVGGPTPNPATKLFLSRLQDIDDVDNPTAETHSFRFVGTVPPAHFPAEFKAFFRENAWLHLNTNEDDAIGIADSESDESAKRAICVADEKRGLDCALIVLGKDPDHGFPVTIVAGLGPDGTLGAARALAKPDSLIYKKLRAIYEMTGYAEGVIRVQNGEPEEDFYKFPTRTGRKDVVNPRGRPER